jgi:two-component system nitrogen regulation sensor histidine kinase GlnL
MISKTQFEAFNTRLLDHLTTAVIVLDRDFCLYHLNPAAEELLETSDRHSHKLPLSDILRNNKEFNQNLNTVFDSGHSLIARQARLVLVNGSRVLVDYAISRLEQPGASFLLLELQEIKRSWNISRKEALLSTHETTVEMIRGLSHEIRNPLGGIRGAAQLLAEELPDPRLQDYTNVIIGETDRLVNLVDRLTGAYKKPNFTRLNIHEVLERVYNLVAAETRGSINITRDYDPSLPEIRGDMEQLIQAVLNIVRNAMQALTENPDPKRRPCITMRTRALSHGTIGSTLHRQILKLELADNGPGVPDDIIENIFYPLISGRAEGTGLGLSIAQNIIKNHDGLIECESRNGHTTFIISIPLQSEEGKDS